MNRCETCVNWSRPTQGESWGAYELGRCVAVPLLYIALGWEDDGSRGIRTQYKDTKAFVQDGENYCGFLLTKPDFGCVDYAPNSN